MQKNVRGNPDYELMKWVVRDEDTDEIIGISPKAPTKVKAYYKLFLQRQNSKEPVDKY